MIKRVENFVMSALFGRWAQCPASKQVEADDGSLIERNEWHWRRWADGGWQHKRMPLDVQREVQSGEIW